MLVLHRANTLDSNELSTYLKNNIGLEIDLRDHLNQLVVSHDPIKNTDRVILLQEFLSIYKNCQSNAMLALNIKSCGLHNMLKDLITEYKIENYFVFDMAVPDTLHYLKSNIKFFTRQSDLEEHPCCYQESSGVWLDEFENHWINEETIMKHINNGKKVGIVSPEIHARSYIEEWRDYKKIMKKNNLDDQIIICTDFPQKFNSL